MAGSQSTLADRQVRPTKQVLVTLPIYMLPSRFWRQAAGKTCQDPGAAEPAQQIANLKES
jgi:hypothetical protein